MLFWNIMNQLYLIQQFQLYVSRNGKSTIINDILGINACATSTKSNVAKTKGAWITLFEPDHDGAHANKEEAKINVEENKSDPDPAIINKTSKLVHCSDNKYYILDMESLTHGVTKFTKKLFYACYAASNVIIWNDKNIDSDDFGKLMNELKEEMKTVPESDAKPHFLYLKRDCGDVRFDPWDIFDAYINKDKSFDYLRKMSIFESFSAFEIKRPNQVGKQALCFSNSKENYQLLRPFVTQITKLANNSKRFSSDMFILKQQIKHINTSAGLSLTKKLILNDDVLKLFAIPKANDPEIDVDAYQRRRDMIYVATVFNWDEKLLSTQFETRLSKLETHFKLDKHIVNGLILTKKELYQRVKNKKRIKGYGATTAKFAAAGADIGGIGVGGLAATAFIVLGGGWTVAAVGGLVYGAFGAAEVGVYGAAVGATVESVQVGKCWYKGDSYVKYALGKTDDEIELERLDATNKR